MSMIPDDLLYLLERPLYGHLATIRPDDTAQVNPMWFAWDGEFLKFTNTSVRQKYRNIKRNPSVAMSVTDPDAPYRYLEVRGIVERIEPDPTGSFFVELAARYGNEDPQPPGDAERRVIYYVRPTAISSQ
ncbi:MAG TPA: PPOX class F420-dependent oxidoreductase [Pseudonocardiaceae bacterium]|jgi:PPOX class probable F420-dependent enzyme